MTATVDALHEQRLAALGGQTLQRCGNQPQRLLREQCILERGGAAWRIRHPVELHPVPEKLEVALATRALLRAIGEQIDGDPEQESLGIAQRQQMLAALQAQVALLRDVISFSARQTRADKTQQLGMSCAA